MGTVALTERTAVISISRYKESFSLCIWMWLRKIITLPTFSSAGAHVLFATADLETSLETSVSNNVVVWNLISILLLELSDRMPKLTLKSCWEDPPVVVPRHLAQAHYTTVCKGKHQAALFGQYARYSLVSRVFSTFFVSTHPKFAARWWSVFLTSKGHKTSIFIESKEKHAEEEQGSYWLASVLMRMFKKKTKIIQLQSVANGVSTISPIKWKMFRYRFLPSRSRLQHLRLCVSAKTKHRSDTSEFSKCIYHCYFWTAVYY